MRLRMVLGIISSCAKRGISPWRFFQLNAPYFNDQKGVFSKLDLEQQVPEKWRLPSLVLDPLQSVDGWKAEVLDHLRLPVFVKPEWGQNGHGIYRARTEQELEQALREVARLETPYFVQQGADYGREIDVFFVGSPRTDQAPRCFSVTEMLDTHGDILPIHSIHNGTQYRDLTGLLTAEDRAQLWRLLSEMGDYRIARVGLKTPSLEALLEGVFQVVEINLFTPMPINLLDEEQSLVKRQEFLKGFAKAVADVIAQSEQQPSKPIFWEKTRRHFALKRKASFDRLHAPSL